MWGGGGAEETILLVGLYFLSGKLGGYAVPGLYILCCTILPGMLPRSCEVVVPSISSSFHLMTNNVIFISVRGRMTGSAWT